MLANIHAATGGNRTFWAYLTLTVVSAILQAAAVLTLFPLFEELFAGAPSEAGFWVLVFLAVIVAAWGVDVWSARYGLRLGLSVMRTIQNRTPEAILAWPNARLTAEKAASLRTLMSNGATEATSSVILMVTPVITAIVFTFALGLGLLAVSFPVSMVTMAGGVLMLLALWASTRIQERAERQFARANEELDSRLFEFAWAQSSLRTARSVSIGQQYVDQAILTARGRVLRLLLWQIPGQFLFSLVLQIVLIGYGVSAWLVYQDGVVGGVAAATLVIVLLRVIEQVTSVSGSIDGLLGINRTLAEVREVSNTQPIVVARSSGHAPLVTASDLNVEYADGTTGLQDVSLTLKPGTVTVVVGRSGAGKTTLIRALAGLIPLRGGAVTFDDISEPASAGELRGNATVVFQQTVLGEGSIKENLRAIDPSLSDYDLRRIADISQLTPMIERSRNGWDTAVGEFGGKLSGGERQRVGVARALAKPARFLLVDEATSAMDSQNERSIIESIGKIRADYTTVVVTHRPATLEIADAVVVMDGGRVIEYGTPAELAAADGAFAQLLEEWRASAEWHVAR